MDLILLQICKGAKVLLGKVNDHHREVLNDLRQLLGVKLLALHYAYKCLDKLINDCHSCLWDAEVILDRLLAKLLDKD
jgi:hypothetical protein